MLDLEPDVNYEVIVLAATRSGYPTVHEDDWPWVSHLMTASEPSPCNAVFFIFINLFIHFLIFSP